MTWSPSAYIDEQVRAWMKGKGWEVTRTEYDFDKEVFAWRHDVRAGPSPTLRISQEVLETYPAFALLHHLDHLRVAQAIRARPGARLVVLQKGTALVLEELSDE